MFVAADADKDSYPHDRNVTVVPIRIFIRTTGM